MAGNRHPLYEKLILFRCSRANSLPYPLATYLVTTLSKIDDLKQLGIDPFANPNITILTYSDILRRFVPSTIIQPDDLDGGIRDCLAAKELCRGYEIDHKQIKRKRYGNFWLDFLNFDRKTEVTGWRFNAVIVIKDNLVTYKLWSGQPLIHELEDNRNPLGPFQGSGEGAARIR